jgi:hypothetical protein
MENSQFLPLTPEQIAAVQAGGGFACCEDPATHTVYHLIQQDEPPTLDDDYFREKIAEADEDIAKHGLQPLDMNAIWRKVQTRLAEREVKGQ